MDKQLFALCIILTILLLVIYQYRKRNEVEHFQTEYLKQFHNYLDGIKEYNQKKREVEERVETELIKKQTPLGKMNNEKILITGATSGIGYTISKYVVKYKCPIFITGKNEESLKRLKDELEVFTKPIYYAKFDLTIDKSVDKLYEKVKREIGCPTIFFNCAILNKGSAYISTKPVNDWKRELDLNIKATILLSQKIGYAMYSKKINGRIILFSTYKSKNKRNNYLNPDKIVTENMIENFSNVYSDEMYDYNIAITCVRVDEDLNLGNTRILGIKVSNSPLQKMVDDTFFTSPKKILPVIDYVCRTPIIEISGKVISTKNFSKNKELMPIVSPNKLIADSEVYNNIFYTKTIPRDKEGEYTSLTKQNPFDPSPKVKKFLNKGSKNFNKFNTLGKYDLILDNVIAKKYGVDKEQIVFFKNEYDATKKITDLFISKGSEIITTSPVWGYLELSAVESKASIISTPLIGGSNKKIKPNFSVISFNPKTKIVFLGTPNHVSGQTIKNDYDWKTFYKKIPDNVILVIDERYVDFVDNTIELDKSQSKPINPIKLLKKNSNIIIMRSFNNFYSVENLELCYLITSKKIANLIRNSQVINPLDKFNENLALTVINDQYYQETKKKITLERQRMMRALTKSNINYYESDANFFLIETDKDSVMADLDSDNIILYNSQEGYDNYWTLPIGEPETNDKVLDILRYSNLDNK